MKPTFSPVLITVRFSRSHDFRKLGLSSVEALSMTMISYPPPAVFLLTAARHLRVKGVVEDRDDYRYKHGKAFQQRDLQNLTELAEWVNTISL